MSTPDNENNSSIEQEFLKSWPVLHNRMSRGTLNALRNDLVSRLSALEPIHHDLFVIYNDMDTYLTRIVSYCQDLETYSDTNDTSSTPDEMVDTVESAPESEPDDENDDRTDGDRLDSYKDAGLGLGPCGPILSQCLPKIKDIVRRMNLCMLRAGSVPQSMADIQETTEIIRRHVDKFEMLASACQFMLFESGNLVDAQLYFSAATLIVHRLLYHNMKAKVEAESFRKHWAKTKQFLMEYNNGNVIGGNGVGTFVHFPA